MTMKKVVAIVLAMVLVAVAAVGSTMAYLTATRSVKNTFTVGNVKITLDETDVDDPTGDRVTSIVNGKDCVFARTDHNGWCYCLIEKAYNAGRIDFKKPISCHLYPIRLSKVGDMVGLEYHRWDICHCARQLGKKMHLPIYQFLKEPLIRRFGQEWYEELCLTATEWKKQCAQ